jgi:hypothetical protein
MIKETLDKRKIDKISVFDFDGTLIDTPLPDYGRIEYEKKTGEKWPHVGWWSKPESLDDKIFDTPTIKPVVQAYEQEKLTPNTLLVMLTGRMDKLSQFVENILKIKNLSFDKYIYNTGGSTVNSKLKSLGELLIEYPNVISVELWEDREEHIPLFEKWGEEEIKKERLKHFKVNRVPSTHH